MDRRLRRQVADSALGRWWHARRDGRSLDAWDEMDERRTAFYANFIRAGDIAFDIGANIGNRTKIFRRLGATVIALEPQPYCQAVLKRAYEGDGKVVIVRAAAGREEGAAEMKVASGHVVSSLSPDWIAKVTGSRRFGDVSWDQTISCRLTTLDRLIATYGRPSFVKIDVEGYELQVLDGLHSPVDALSFEFTPEDGVSAFACIDRLEALGMTQFSYSAGESMQLDKGWCGSDRMKAVLGDITDSESFGDVYARTPAE